MARSDPTRSVRAVAFSVFEVTTAVLYGVYEHTLASIVPYLVPEHTREAAFQLFCDLRSNTPKDRRFVKRHMAALLPETITGWIAMMSTALYAGGALAATLCVLLGVASAALFSCVGLVLVTGGFLGTAFAVFALGLLATSCIAGVLGSATALGYVSVVTTSSAWRYLFGVLFRGAPVIPDSIRELPVSKSAGQVFGLSPAGPVRGDSARASSQPSSAPSRAPQPRPTVAQPPKASGPADALGSPPVAASRDAPPRAAARQPSTSAPSAPAHSTSLVAAPRQHQSQANVGQPAKPSGAVAAVRSSEGPATPDKPLVKAESAQQPGTAQQAKQAASAPASPAKQPPAAEQADHQPVAAKQPQQAQQAAGAKSETAADGGHAGASADLAGKSGAGAVKEVPAPAKAPPTPIVPAEGSAAAVQPGLSFAEAASESGAEHESGPAHATAQRSSGPAAAQGHPNGSAGDAPRGAMNGTTASASKPSAAGKPTAGPDVLKNSSGAASKPVAAVNGLAEAQTKTGASSGNGVAEPEKHPGAAAANGTAVPAVPATGSAAAVQPGISFAAVADAAQETHIAEAAANGISEDGSSKLGADAPSRSASDASETSQPGKPSRKSSKARRKAQAAARAQQ